ncbi:otoraplin-like [Rhinichthys klamathensis goyatoka]|uniref:otoraplin-like n=1 Tax=Rhinichthys klamathensis goyatoka TaxID=3034132 RepID=UPI0024B5E3A3|nr:otoraplin-like [Rhinichthys klamathensis goyatoka]
MDTHHGLMFLCICVGLGCITTHTHTALVEKLADRKICADKHCSYVLSEARALEDYVAPDCRFINLRRGQQIYVFSKLKPVEGAGVFWSGSVYGERYVHQMGIVGYFPSNYINETRVFQKNTVEIPTTDMDFFCA